MAGGWRRVGDVGRRKKESGGGRRRMEKESVRKAEQGESKMEVEVGGRRFEGGQRYEEQGGRWKE